MNVKRTDDEELYCFCGNDHNEGHLLKGALGKKMDDWIKAKGWKKVKDAGRDQVRWPTSSEGTTLRRRRKETEEVVGKKGGAANGTTRQEKNKQVAEVGW